MGKYKVKSAILYDGKKYHEGESIELTKKAAKALSHVIEPLGKDEGSTKSTKDKGSSKSTKKTNAKTNEESES